MGIKRALQSLLHLTTSNGETRHAMVIDKPTQHTRISVRPTANIPGIGLTTKETRDGTFLKVREPDGRTVVIPVTHEVWNANAVNHRLVRTI